MNIFKLLKRAGAIKRLLKNLASLAAVMPEVEDVEEEYKKVKATFRKALADGKVTAAERKLMEQAQCEFGGELLDVVGVAMPVWKRIKANIKEIAGK